MSEEMVGSRARRLNPALASLAFLVGKWSTVGSHPAFPGEKLSGRTTFAWAENGAFLIMRSQTDHSDFPDGIAVFSSDNVLGKITMSWFDERGISRLCPASVTENSVSWHHDDPKFMQRVVLTADPDQCHMHGKGEMAEHGGKWGDDLSQEFTRI